MPTHRLNSEFNTSPSWQTVGRARVFCRAFVVLMAQVSISLGNLPAYEHVVVVVEENHSFSQILGSNQAPYINQLAGEGVLFTSMFGVTHPSQPNYLHLFSGANQGVTDDSLPTGTPFGSPNLGAALLAGGYSFAGYSEGLPALGSTVERAGAYRRRHSPWVNWQDDSNGRSPFALPSSANLPFSMFPQDPADFSSLPTVSFVIPDLNHDMHDGTVQQADSWLKSSLSAYQEWSKANNSLLIVAWDEDNFQGTNRVPLIFSGANLIPGEIDTTYTLHHLLRTLEEMYDLEHSGAAAKVNAMRGAFAGEENLSTRTRIFQQGVDGFVGVTDIELRRHEPDVVLNAGSVITVDLDNSDLAGDQPSQALIRFDDIVGFGVGQIPPGARIDSAQLVLTTGTDSNADPSSSDIELHRMLVPWDASSTWNSLTDGIGLDDVEAIRESDFLAQPNAAGAPAIFTTTQTVQSWVDGQRNNGWLLASHGSDGWGWSSSDASQIRIRPKLEIVYFSTTTPGDFNLDGIVGVDDIDALSEVVGNKTNDLAFDLNGDQLVNNGDRTFWVQHIKQTWFGDVNLDGYFDTKDLVSVFQTNEYDDVRLNNSTWADGDWNGNGEFDSADLVIAFQDGGYEHGRRPNLLAAVPEPSCLFLLSIAGLIVARGVR